MGASALRRSSKPVVSDPAPQEIAGYLKDMADGLRMLTRHGRDLAFLDYLLAMVAEEAEHVASHQNH